MLNQKYGIYDEKIRKISLFINYLNVETTYHLNME